MANNPKGEWNKAITGTRAEVVLLPMILCNLSLEIEHLLEPDFLNRTINECIHEVMEIFYVELGGIRWRMSMRTVRSPTPSTED